MDEEKDQYAYCVEERQLSLYVIFPEAEIIDSSLCIP